MWVEALPFALGLAVAGVFVALLHPGSDLRAWLLDRFPTLAPPRPDHRPLEELARTARRLGARHHHPPAGERFAKHDGIRQAYDRVLGELCDELRLSHLLGVLPPGSDLAAERRRVERALELNGVELSLPL